MTKFYLTDTNEFKTVQAKAWTGHGFGPDRFPELAAENLQELNWDEPGGFYRTQKEEFTELTNRLEKEFGFWVEGKTHTGEEIRPIDMYLIIETA